MSLNNRERVEKIEAALTPQQTALLLMKKALSSASDYRHWFLGYLERHEQIRNSRSHELPPFMSPVISDQRVRVSFGELNVLLHIWTACNEFAIELAQEMVPLAGWLSADVDEMRRLSGKRRKALESSKIIADAPYPLDSDDAAAIRAAVDRYVVIFEALVGNYLPTWFERCRIESAKSSRSQSPDGSFQHDSAAISVTELPGLASQTSVADRDFYDVRRAFEKAVHGLIVAGAFEGGSAVEIGPLPFEFLSTAPLFDRQWIDRHLVELAELGARVEECGYEFRARDDHWLQPQRICRRACQRFVDADDVEIVRLREEAKAALAKFGGRSMEIDGYSYLHVEDYRSWQDRKVKENLTILDGVSASSWNSWIDAHGGEGVAELAGIRLGKVDGHPNSSQPADACDNAHASLLESQPLMTKADAVRDNATVLLENLFALRITIATISKSNFASHPVLFKKQEARLDELIDIAENLGEQYHKILDFVDPGSGGGTGRFKVDIARTRQRARNASETTVASLIYRAKRGALLDLGATKSLAEMMLADLKGDPA